MYVGTGGSLFFTDVIAIFHIAITEHQSNCCTLYPSPIKLLCQTSATAIILSAAILAMLWALVQFLLVSRIPVRSEGISDSTGLVSGSNDEATTRRLTEIYTAIYEGAESFLRAEYTICAYFIASFGVIIFVSFD